MKIGNGQGFLGDSPKSAKGLLEACPDLDFITFDYLSEAALSIFAMQKQKDPSLGYAKDFIQQVEDVLPFWEKGSSCKLVANAGGLNPKELGRVLFERTGKKVGVVLGDDVLGIAPFSEGGFVSANAYLGASPIVSALEQGAMIVVTGRVADPSLVVACARYGFSWDESDYDLIAKATVAGHLIECGRQATGGLFTDWLTLKEDPPFPIVEMFPSGSFSLLNGLSEHAIKEQLLYEVQDPSCLITPDVKVSFENLTIGEKIEGAKGEKPTDHYKVSATKKEGYMSEGFLALVGEDLREKAERIKTYLLQRLKNQGMEFDQVHLECIGLGDLMPNDTRCMPKECMMRLALRSMEKEPLVAFSKELASFVTSGPPGTTGYMGGRPKVREVFRFYPLFIEKKKVVEEVLVLG